MNFINFKTWWNYNSLTPDWETIYETFYEDFTHRTPFTIESKRYA